MTVAYATTDGSATSPGDFDALSGTLTFNAGTTVLSIDVVVHGDTIDEVDETLMVTLSVPTNATLATAVATGAPFPLHPNPGPGRHPGGDVNLDGLATRSDSGAAAWTATGPPESAFPVAAPAW